MDGQLTPPSTFRDDATAITNLLFKSSVYNASMCKVYHMGWTKKSRKKIQSK